ncbi:MAG TPA: hypothetical protein PKA64_24295 [Myxococcota bacterium]|nr:hypothetical protein [Myxococcota bacterium]
MQSVMSRTKSKVGSPPPSMLVDMLDPSALHDAPTDLEPSDTVIKRRAPEDDAPVKKAKKDDEVSVSSPLPEPFIGPPIDTSVNPFTPLFTPTKERHRKHTPLRRPQRKGSNKDYPEGTIEQPIRKLTSATAPKFSFPPNLDELVSSSTGLKGFDFKAPTKEPVDSLTRLPGMDTVLDAFDLSGGKQGGKYPAKHLHESPEVADYTQARPLQMLSDFSDILLSAAESEGQSPVEIQFGYGLGDTDEPDVYASSNNKESQEWLFKALQNPGSYVEKALGSGDENIRAIAAKLMFHEEQTKQRKDRVLSSSLPNQEELLGEIDLATKIRHKILTGSTGLAYNPLGGKTGARHAEQNIADVMHGKGYKKAEIGGTKIRCEACTSELGPAMLDDEDRWSMGKFYGAQASKGRHEDTWGMLESGKAKVSQKQVSRPRSNSTVAKFG